MFLVWLMFGVFVGVMLGIFILSMTLARKEQESTINQDDYKFEQSE